MSPEFSPQRSDAIRAELISTVEATAAQRLTGRPHRWLATLGVLTAGMLIGGAVSAAAFTLGGVNSSAPLLPGQDVATPLNAAVTVTVTGDERIPLLGIPAGTTHVRIAVVCLSAGHSTWGLDPTGNNPGMTCDEDDVDGHPAWIDIEILPGNDAIYVHARATTTIRLTYSFQSVERQPLAVNDSGETYGVDYLDGEGPDLIAVYGLDSDGNQVQGYVRSTDFYAFGPDHPDLPSNPEEALRWQAERAAAYPDGWDLPVYESDGRTQIGTYHVQNG